MKPTTGTLYWLPLILGDESLDAVETLLMVALADHVGVDDECYVGIQTLAKAARCSYGTARRRLAALEQRGVISRTQRAREDGGDSVYDYLLNRDPARNLRGGVRAPGRAGGRAHPDARARRTSPKEPPRKNKAGGLFDEEDPNPESPPSDPVVAGFEECWEIYPKRERRKEALSAYRARVREGVSDRTLLRSTRNYAAAMVGTDPKFVMQGPTFYGPNERYLPFATDEEPEQEAV